MAKVIWTKPAHAVRRKFYLQGMKEFGEFTANKTDEIIKTLEDELSRWPVSGFPEPLLRGLVPFYRARHINKRYKIIYWYDEPNDTVVIEDIWDSRRSPQHLVRRLRK